MGQRPIDARSRLGRQLEVVPGPPRDASGGNAAEPGAGRRRALFVDRRQDWKGLGTEVLLTHAGWRRVLPVEPIRDAHEAVGASGAVAAWQLTHLHLCVALVGGGVANELEAGLLCETLLLVSLGILAIASQQLAEP